MKHRSIKLISLLLSFILVTSSLMIFPTTIFAADANETSVGITRGTTGDCTWTLDGTKLIINGNGSMGGYYSTQQDSLGIDRTNAPWGWEITELVIEDGVTGLSNYAFYGCSNLTRLQLPNTLTKINWCAFKGCEKLTQLTVPDSVTLIDDYSFENCKNLTNIILSNSLETIGFSAFRGCTNLTNIVIPDGVDRIGTYAFENCTSLVSITVPDSVMRVGNNVVRNTAWFNNQPDGVVYFGKVAYTFKGSIPSNTSINLKADTLSIAENAFRISGNNNIVSAFIPSSIKYISEEPFAYCENLANISVDAANEVYDSRNNCNAIIKTSDNKLIQGCKNTVIPDSVKTIGYCAFEGCYNLVNLSISTGVTSIEQSAFANCKGLESIIIPNSVTELGRYLFTGCTKLKTVTLGNGLSYISHNMFSDWTSLETVTIPEGVTIMYYDAFHECTSLTEVTIPTSVTEIRDDVFYGCTSITDVNYTGTSEQWNAIKTGKNNQFLKNATIHYNYVPEPTDCEELGQQHAWNKTSLTLPTCISDGKEEYVCTKCMATKTEVLHATGHVKGQWETVEEPSETEEGLRVRKCTVCGTMLESETIPLLVPQASGKIIAESVTGRIGETVDVNISIRDNPGITSLQLKVGYSADDLELTQIIDNSLFDSSISHSKLTNNPVKISWFSSLSDDNDENGVLATLRFRIKSGAKDSTVMLSYDQPNIFNISGQEISFNTYAGTVSVDNTKVLSSIAVSEMPTKTVYEIGESLDTTGLQLKLIYSDGSVSYATSGFTTGGFSSASEGAKMVTVHYQDKTISFEVTVNPHAEQPTYSDKSPRFIIGSSTGKPDETVDIKVSIENNPAITALQVKIGYSSEDLELIEIKDDYLFGSPISGSKYLTDNPQIISWFSRDSEDHIENGTIATLRFKIKPNAKDSNITLSFKKSNIFNSNFEEFDFQTVNGTVYVTQSAILFGDVDNDGDIEIRDATWIQRHVALMEIPIAVHKAIADVDSDGEITLMDATLIQRYLANLKSNDKIGKLLAG